MVFGQDGNEEGGENAGYRIELREPLGSENIEDKDGEKVQVIEGQTGAELVKNYIQLVYTYLASIIGIVAVLIIVVSGVQMMMGGADPDMVTQAKTRIFQAILSLILLFLSAAILYTVNPGFFTRDTEQNENGGGEGG
ncbi:pilin [Candidatus Gracilibacteria bacterium]|nr:pilin [Candidatus Gracilibacteria bacterium]MCF7819280.1 pilin [Candidatus Gracilibacteria bacterium]